MPANGVFRKEPRAPAYAGTKQKHLEVVWEGQGMQLCTSSAGSYLTFDAEGRWDRAASAAAGMALLSASAFGDLGLVRTEPEIKWDTRTARG